MFSSEVDMIRDDDGNVQDVQIHQSGSPDENPSLTQVLKSIAPEVSFTNEDNLVNLIGTLLAKLTEIDSVLSSK